MPVEVRHSPPPLHRPSHSDVRPKGILKNPSFSGPSGRQISPEAHDITNLPPSGKVDPQDAKEITLQNTLQNAGHRRSSSAARRASASRRQSSAIAANYEDDPEKMRLKWDEANLFLAEQESGGRMKITEPKTPYQYGEGAMEEEEEEDVAIDPRYVNVDEMDMVKKKTEKKARESEIPGLDIGEPEDESTEPAVENDRILRRASMSRENSKEKHVSVSGEGGIIPDNAGMADTEEQEKHRQFEEQRKRHYEMRDVKGLLGHPEDVDMDEDEEESPTTMPKSLPSRGVNGTR